MSRADYLAGVPGAGVPAAGTPAAGTPAAGTPAAGFTLVEVLVALAVVSLALPALLFSLNQQVDGTAYLRDRSLAEMVAANKLEELRILARARESLTRGKYSGQLELAEREWYWWLEAETTEVENFFRVEIRVAGQETAQDSPLATLVAFMLGDLRAEEEGGGG